jgi:hypothetical protein
MSERIQLALMLAAGRGLKRAEDADFQFADRFLASPMVAAHDRRVAREALEDAACKIPDTVDALQTGESATHWLSKQAGMLA